MWLLKLPGFFRQGPVVERMLATISLVVVFPLDPVTAATRPFSVRRWAWASDQRASRVSGTRMVNPGAGTGAWTSAAHAPRWPAGVRWGRAKFAGLRRSSAAERGARCAAS